MPPQLAAGRRAALNFLIAQSGLLVCLLFLLMGLATVGDYGITADERNQRRIAAANLDYILGQTAAFDPLPYPYAYYGVAFELPLLLTERALGLADYRTIHRLRLALTHLFFIVGGYFCYRLAYQLFGSRLLALLALLIFLLHPRIYAHSFYNPKDLPFLSMFAIALYLLDRAFRKDRIGAFLVLGIAVGLLTNLRIMGIMLFAAVIALRGLDLFYAGNWVERRGLLLTGGMFALAAGLTLYAVTPYAWGNPVDYLTTSLDLTANHPGVEYRLFQGALLPARELPHYNAVWFALTAPPLILLLGVIGMAAVLARGLGRPGAVFRNTRLRFLGLLLACFLLPPLAAALMGSNQQDDWRHFYFVYAPFALLAAGGLHWLSSARARPLIRAGVYGLAGAGLGLIALQMTQIHPWQDNYFNFLVDRTTPEYLQTQYHLSSPNLPLRAALKELRERHPGEFLVVRVGSRDPLLSVAGTRLIDDRDPAAADYALVKTWRAQQHQDLAFNSLPVGRIYNNTLLLAKPFQDSRMTAAGRAAYREIYRQALAGEPIIRAAYNVYLQGQTLTFIRENCQESDREQRVFAKLLPSDNAVTNDPAPVLRSRGARLGDACLAVLPLPAAAPDNLMVGQDQAGTTQWAELYSRARPGPRERIAAARRENAAPPGPAEFAVFLERDAAGRPRLLYAKADCSMAEYLAPVTLHIYPVNRADLPFYRWPEGRDNRDFYLTHFGGRLTAGECVAAVALRDYPIAAIHTGQAGVWERNIYPPADPESLRAAYAALSDRQPDFRAAFDLYIQDNRLIYLRETCAAADAAAGFFLHILPAEVAALPAERQAAGFANLDFAFDRWGGSFDGKCLAAVPLPDYPIKSIRTGQFQTGQGELWAAELPVGR